MDTAYVRETPPLKQPKNVIGYSTSICPVGGSPSVYSKSQTSKDLEVLVSNRSSAQASIVKKKYTLRLHGNKWGVEWRKQLKDDWAQMETVIEEICQRIMDSTLSPCGALGAPDGSQSQEHSSKPSEAAWSKNFQ